MNRALMSAVILLGFAGGPLLVGCDTTEQSKSTEVKDDGTVVLPFRRVFCVAHLP